MTDDSLEYYSKQTLGSLGIKEKDTEYEQKVTYLKSILRDHYRQGEIDTKRKIKEVLGLD